MIKEIKDGKIVSKCGKKFLEKKPEKQGKKDDGKKEEVTNGRSDIR